MKTVIVHAGGNHLYMTFLYAGLYRLQHQNRIRLAFVKPDHTAKPSSGLLLSMQVVDDRSRSIICFDMADATAITIDDPPDFDFLFKRSFTKAALNAPGKDKRIYPFGLIFPCRYAARWRAIWNLYVSTLGAGKVEGSVKHRLGQWYNYWRLPELAAYENGAEKPGEGYILYQTRAWNPANYENWQEINQSRLKVIRALQSRFKERFVGGFMPDAFAVRHYSDAITTFPSSRKRYVELIKKAQVCVYTAGLFDSPAFKMGEYLASGRCIVAEPLANELPEPLQAGRHYLPFQSADECLQQCERLLQDSEMAQAMQHNNVAYYREHVEPSRQMERVLNIVMTTQQENRPRL
jgi:hypothetical protein